MKLTQTEQFFCFVVYFRVVWEVFETFVFLYWYGATALVDVGFFLIGCVPSGPR